MIEHGTNLVKRDTWKPFDELRHHGAILEICKERGYGHARAAEYPSAADPFRIPFDYRTGRPIDHGKNGITPAARWLTRTQKHPEHPPAGKLPLMANPVRFSVSKEVNHVLPIAT